MRVPALAAELRPALAPAAILVAAALALWAGPALPESLSGLREYGAAFVLVAAAGMALWFNRGRALVAAVSLLLACAGYRYALGFGAESFAARAVFSAAAVLVPLNVLAALVLPERGVSHHADYRWLFLALGEVVLVAWIAASGRSVLSGVAWQELFEHWLLRAPPVPLLGRLLFCGAFAAALWRAWPDKATHLAPLETGLAGAVLAFYVACEAAANAAAFGAFGAAAGAILVVALLQESHRMAFKDGLTGLPNRRALDEELRALGPHYAIAMADVDHFKSFNDEHGHDIGDQVLRLVAARLARVEGGGRAFRFGGEEFTVLFPGASLTEAMPHLERIRGEIERYQMAMRGEDRPKDPEEGEKRRAGASADGEPADKVLSVTVSFGAAEPGGKATAPAQVLKAADKALYRAKRAGRNQVSR